MHAPNPKNKKKGLALRRLVLLVLLDVFERRSSLEKALSYRGYDRFEYRDRSFCRALCSCILRRVGQLDAVIDACLRKPLPPEHRRLRMILRLSAAQSLYFQTPLYAVAGLSAELAQEDKSTRSFRPLVYALARAMTEKGRVIAEATPLEHNLPVWIRKSWSQAYGVEAVREIAGVFAVPPPLDITLKNPLEHDIWAERLEVQLLPSGTLRRHAIGDVRALAGYDMGSWWVQDAAASLPVQLLDPRPREKILDACAAPGGKTLQLAAGGAQVTALDISQQRLNLVHDNLRRTGLSAQLICADARSWMLEKEGGLFDAILLDAPCTATGTLRRHPDVVWTKTPQDVENLLKEQSCLLKSATSCLRPGGRLIFSLCSLQPEESLHFIDRVASFIPDLALDSFKDNEVEDVDIKVSEEGSIRTFPFFWKERGGMDGFFMVRFRKTCS